MFFLTVPTQLQKLSFRLIIGMLEVHVIAIQMEVIIWYYNTHNKKWELFATSFRYIAIIMYALTKKLGSVEFLGV